MLAPLTIVPESIEFATHRKNLRILLNLRGAAFCAQILAIATAYYGFSIVLPVVSMLGAATILVVFNLYCFYRLRSPRAIKVADLFMGLIVDVAILTAQLAMSGGTANPFVSFYMLPVIVGAVMLSAAYAWMIYGLTLFCYLGLAIAAYFQPMPAMPDMGPGLVDRFSLHMHGMMLGYALSAGLLVFLITRIRANLQARDDELAAIKTRALQEEHMIRLGLLAAGAAHELGTPLTTLSIILKDLLDLPLPKRKAYFVQDVTTMQSQVDRCKVIVSDILSSAGQTRGEGGERRPLKAFLTGLCEDWHRGHSDADLRLSVTASDAPILADRIIEQALCNLLDNAYEASEAAGGNFVALTATETDHDLVVDVVDKGPGFDDEITGKIGMPYNTTKAADGRHRGNGLYLVANTLRVLGGGLAWGNQVSGGASVRMTIPLGAIRIVDDV